MRTNIAAVAAIFLGLSSALSGARAASAPVSKRPLDQAAYARWSWIVEPSISDDGRLVSYTTVTAAGDGTLVMHWTKDGKDDRFPRGKLTTAALGLRPPEGFSAAALAPDASYAVFTMANAAGQAPFDLSVVTFPRKEVQVISGVARFQVSKKSRQFLGYLTQQAGGAATLTVRDLKSGRQFEIRDVGEFLFDDAGDFLVYTLVTSDARSGVYSRRLSDSVTSTLLAGAGHYSNLTLDDEGKQLAFVSDQAERQQPTPRNSLYYVPSLTGTASVVVKATELQKDFILATDPSLRFVRTGAALMFGMKPSFDSAATPEALAPLGAEPSTEKDGDSADASVGQSIKELWQWKEAKPLKQAVPSNQPVCGGIYTGVVQLASRRWTQLENAATPLVLLGADGKYGVGIGLHSLQDTWDVPTIDTFIVDARTGERRPLRQNMQPQQQYQLLEAHDSTLDGQRCGVSQSLITLSATGRYAMYFEKERWWSVDLQTGSIADLTGSLIENARFDDSPTQAPASQRLTAGTAGGIAGWTADDHSVLLYADRDIWEMDPAGKRPPRNLTQGAKLNAVKQPGEITNDNGSIVFRLLEQDADLAMAFPHAGLHKPLTLAGERARFLDLRKPLLLAGVDQDTMATSVWEMPAGAARPPKQLIRVDKRLTPIAKARNADQLLFTRETYNEFPDLWVGPSVERLRRVSDVNPQQREYQWGSVELIDYLSDFGVQLKAKLYKPEGFDPARKYPMIVAIDDLARMSLHEYTNPQTLAGAFPTAAWPAAVSRGYLLLVPDVLPASPLPAQSAVAAAVPATYAVIDMGYADPERIALSGHGYGAFEAQYVLVQSNIYRCAVTSGGFIDMVSLALADRNHEPAEVERGFGRMGGSVWDRPYLYFSNSFLYAANQVNTPLLVVHNDHDSVIPFEQSMGLYRALRRNSKEVYFYNYFGEDHVLAKPENRADWDQRVFAYLDYFLKNGPRPSWMDAATPDAERGDAPAESSSSGASSSSQ